MFLICVVATTVGGANGLVVIWPIFGQFSPEFQCAEPSLPNKTCSLMNGQACANFVYDRESFNLRHTWRNESQVWDSGKPCKLFKLYLYSKDYNTFITYSYIPLSFSCDRVRSGLFQRKAFSYYDLAGNGWDVHRSCVSLEVAKSEFLVFEN